MQYLGCLPSTGPHPPDQSEICATVDAEENLAPCGCPTWSPTPPPPDAALFPIIETEECRKRLQEWLLNYYSSTTFNSCPHQESKGMSRLLVKLAIKPEAELVCHTKPFKVSILRDLVNTIESGFPETREELPKAILEGQGDTQCK